MESTGEDGTVKKDEGAYEGALWQTTQLDSTIGDLQRGKGPAAGEEAAGEVEKAATEVKKKRRRKPRVVPSVRIYYGTFVHSTGPDGIEVLQNWLLGVDGGKIIFSEKSENYRRLLEEYKLTEFEKECVITIEEGTFMMPGFVDCHTHAVPYLVSGLLLDTKGGLGTKVDGLLDRRRKKLSLIADDRIATETFNKLVQHSLREGITCASYNGSAVESAARLLTDAVVRCKQRAQIGMEIFYGDNRDDTHMFQMIKAKDVVNHILRKKNDLVQPCLIFSKPLPEWMETKVVEMAKDMDLPIKTTIGDFPEEEMNSGLRQWLDLGQKRLLRYHKKCGVLGNKLIVVNGSLCTGQELNLIAESGAAIAYCPSASLLNCTFSSLSRFTSRHITVGLGTDINTSHCVSMLDTLRRCIQCTVLSCKWPQPVIVKTKKVKDDKVKEHVVDIQSHSYVDNSEEKIEVVVSEDEDEEEDTGPEEIVDVSLMRLFHMATLGGATVLGLENRIGNFEIGKEFDALHINPNALFSKFMVIRNQDTILEVVEKFLTVGDDRNIVGVYIKGERLI